MIKLTGFDRGVLHLVVSNKGATIYFMKNSEAEGGIASLDEGGQPLVLTPRYEKYFTGGKRRVVASVRMSSVAELVSGIILNKGYNTLKIEAIKETELDLSLKISYPATNLVITEIHFKADDEYSSYKVIKASTLIPESNKLVEARGVTKVADVISESPEYKDAIEFSSQYSKQDLQFICSLFTFIKYDKEEYVVTKNLITGKLNSYNTDMKQIKLSKESLRLAENPQDMFMPVGTKNHLVHYLMYISEKLINNSGYETINMSIEKDGFGDEQTVIKFCSPHHEDRLLVQFNIPSGFRKFPDEYSFKVLEENAVLKDIEFKSDYSYIHANLEKVNVIKAEKLTNIIEGKTGESSYGRYKFGGSGLF